MNKLTKYFATAGFALLANFTFIVDNAASAGNSFGVRGGYDTDYDQLLIGAQSELGKVLEIARFAPSVDLGFGNNLTTFAFNGDVRVFLTPPKASATLYGGAGLTMLIVEPKGGDSDSEFGLTLSGGVKFGAGKTRIYNAEARLGIDKMPDLRLLFGIFF